MTDEEMFNNIVKKLGYDPFEHKIEIEDYGGVIRDDIERDCAVLNKDELLFILHKKGLL